VIIEAECNNCKRGKTGKTKGKKGARRVNIDISQKRERIISEGKRAGNAVLFTDI
jgi:hypothetical protein